MDEYKKYYYERIGGDLVINLPPIDSTGHRVAVETNDYLPFRAIMETSLRERLYVSELAARTLIGTSRTFTLSCLFLDKLWRVER